MKESSVQAQVRLMLSSIGSTSFRNNVGTALSSDGSGRRIKFGVGNPGGSDLIGWTPVVITPDMVGCRVGVFTCIETKRTKGGRTSEDQLNFIAQVNKAGGIAGVANSAEAAKKIIEDWRPIRFVSSK